MGTFIDADGKEQTQEMERSKSLSLRFMQLLMSHLHDRAARNWKYFDYYLETILAFGIHTPEELESEASPQDAASWSKKSQGYKIGMELFFKKNMLETMGDWVLGDASPLTREKRVQMGGSYVKANFGSVTKLITIMISD